MNLLDRLVRFTLMAASLSLLAIALSEVTSTPLKAQSPDIRGPFVGPVAHAATFDGDVRRLPPAPAPLQAMRPAADTEDRVWGALHTDALDPVRQRAYRPASMPTLIQNFKGMNKADNGNGYPPDTNGDVGPNHYIQTVNTSVGIYDKNGAQLIAFTFNTLFDGTGTPCDSANGGDPIVLYDSISGRWIVTDFAWANLDNGPYYECIAVSKSGDPVSGGWWFYGYQTHDTFLPDYPKLGIWSDGIYMLANLFDVSPSGDTFEGVRVWAFDRDRLINGSPLDDTIYFDVSNISSVLPSHFRATAPLAGEPNFFMARSSPVTLRLYKFHADFSTPANSTFSGPTNMSATPWMGPPATVPENGGNNLDTIDSRLMMQNQYARTAAGESLWLNHTISSGGVAALRWYEIRDPNGSPSIYQESTFQPDSNHRWIGSLAVDKAGNMAIGYSVSSSSMFPDIRYAGRVVADALNTLGQGESVIISGTGAQTNNCGGKTCTRWGDYSAMSVDPSDNCTFWYTNEYYETSGGNWQTRIASFRYPNCTLPEHLYLPLIVR